MVLKFSLDIIFSIFLFGAGKSTLDINITAIKIIKKTRIIFINSLTNVASFPELVFFVNCIYFK